MHVCIKSTQSPCTEQAGTWLLEGCTSVAGSVWSFGSAEAGAYLPLCPTSVLSGVFVLCE